MTERRHERVRVEPGMDGSWDEQDEAAMRVEMGGRTFNADECEQIFHTALATGDVEGVHAALTVMAPQDPHRAQRLVDMLELGLAVARACDGREER